MDVVVILVPFISRGTKEALLLDLLGLIPDLEVMLRLRVLERFVKAQR